MKPPHFRFLLAALFLTVVRAWAGEVSPVQPAADGTYTVTVKATHKFTRNTDKLKNQAVAAATEFCAKAGKQLKVVSVDESKSMYVMGDFAHVTLTFKALAADAPELAPTAAPGAPQRLTTDQLAAELAKLDELRKKGLLTEAEFGALKQKVLDRY